MSETEELKLWFSGEIKKQMEHVATKDQFGAILLAVDANTAASKANSEALARQQDELNQLREYISGNKPSVLPSLSYKNPNISLTMPATYAGAASAATAVGGRLERTGVRHRPGERLQQPVNQLRSSDRM